MAITFKAGRLPNDPSQPRLKASTALDEAAVPPDAVDNYSLVTVWGMLLNDQLGDCTCAGNGHICEQQTALGLGKETEVTDNETLTMYEAVGHYVPGNPSTDNGATVQSALSYLRKTGVAGFKLAAFAEVDVTNHQEVKQAAFEFGALSIGINLPDSAMNQFNAGQPWTVVEGSAIDGGHCVIVVGYDADWVYVVTWGAVQKMSWGFWETYVEEAWAVISRDWQSKSGLSLVKFGAEFAKLTGDANPFPSASPTPAPAVTPPLSFWQRVWQILTGS